MGPQSCRSCSKPLSHGNYHAYTTQEGKGFFDITESQELKDIEISRKKKSSENVVYPTAVAHTKAVKALILSLQDTVMSHNREFPLPISPFTSSSEPSYPF